MPPRLRFDTVARAVAADTIADARPTSAIGKPRAAIVQ